MYNVMKSIFALVVYDLCTSAKLGDRGKMDAVDTFPP